jgi:hypothetical protein
MTWARYDSAVQVADGTVYVCQIYDVGLSLLHILNGAAYSLGLIAGEITPPRRHKCEAVIGEETSISRLWFDHVESPNPATWAQVSVRLEHLSIMGNEEAKVVAKTAGFAGHFT